MDAQQLMTWAVVLAAAGYLARRIWLRLWGRGTGSCGSCSRCFAAADVRRDAAKPLIPIETLIASADRKQAEQPATGEEGGSAITAGARRATFDAPSKIAISSPFPREGAGHI